MCLAVPPLFPLHRSGEDSRDAVTGVSRSGLALVGADGSRASSVLRSAGLALAPGSLGVRGGRTTPLRSLYGCDLYAEIVCARRGEVKGTGCPVSG